MQQKWGVGNGGSCLFRLPASKTFSYETSIDISFFVVLFSFAINRFKAAKPKSPEFC
jgi:hypothetical protein